MGDEGDAEVGDHASLLLGKIKGGGLIERSRCGRSLAGVVMSLECGRRTPYEPISCGIVIGAAEVGISG